MEKNFVRVGTMIDLAVQWWWASCVP